MTNSDKALLGGVGVVFVLLVCCLGMFVGQALDRNRGNDAAVVANPTTGVVAEEAVRYTPPAVPTAVPSVPPAPPLPTLPSSVAVGEFQALATYAEAIKPILEEGLGAAERDGAILQAGENDPSALCGGHLVAHPTLLADAAIMHRLSGELERVSVPASAQQPVHRPLTDSVRLWAEALDNINQSCLSSNEAEQNLLRLGAGLQLGGSLINFRVAHDNFWRLVIVNGLETIVGSPPQP